MKLKRSPLLRLPHLTIVRTSHLRPQTNQHLLHAHISIPISRSRDFGIDNLPSVGIDAAHVDFGNEADFGGYGGVAFGDGDAQFVETHFVLGLYIYCEFIYSISFMALSIVAAIQYTDKERYLCEKKLRLVYY